MFDQFLWLPFLVAITVLTMTPGVDTLLVMRNTARGGRKDGFLTNIGICSGLFIHALVSAAGLSVILLSSAELFTLLKYAGAGYLIWLGIQSLRSAARLQKSDLPETVSLQPTPAIQSLREGLLSNVLNPKTVIFYMAFLPQFIDPTYSALPQALMMAGIHFLIGIIWQSGLVIMVNQARSWLKRPTVKRVMDSISGTLFLGFGIKLTLSP